MNFGKQFKDGLLLQNPVTVQLLGMCSVMAITTTLFNGIGMGLSVTIILTCSNIVISLLRKVIPSKLRIAAFIVVISTFVTIVDLVLQAFIPALSDSMGVFIPLIVVNCIILGRAEAFSYKNGVGASAIDGIAQGLGYTVTAFNRQTSENGYMVFYIGTEPGKMAQAEEGFKRIINDLHQNLLSEEDVNRGKNQLEGDYYRNMQSLGSRSGEAAALTMEGYPLSFTKDQIEKSKNVTPEQLREIVKKYLDVDSAYTIKVLP